MNNKIFNCKYKDCRLDLREDVADIGIEEGKLIEYRGLYCPLHGYNATVEIIFYYRM